MSDTSAKGYKLKVRLPDGRLKLCGCGTRDHTRYDEMRAWVQSLKRGRTRRIDVLEAIVLHGVSLADAFDHRRDLDAVLGLAVTPGVRNVEPLVAKWYAEKSKSRKGAASAARYVDQVRRMLPEGKPALASQYNAQVLRSFLRGLDVDDPTRNRHKAAHSSFVAYLVDEGVYERNWVHDIPGWSEGQGNEERYTMAEAQAVYEHMQQPYKAMFALAVSSALDRSTLPKLRVQDIDLTQELPRVWADGGKTPWRRRTVYIVEEWHWCLPAIREVLANKLPSAPVFEWGRDDEHAVLDAIADAAKAAGIRRLTLRDQRHTFASNMLELGYDPQIVAYAMGHSNTNLVWRRYGRYRIKAEHFVPREIRKRTVEQPSIKEGA